MILGMSVFSRPHNRRSLAQIQVAPLFYQYSRVLLSNIQLEIIKRRTPCSGKDAAQKLERITINRVDKPVMANGRCRLHGGKSTGAKITEGSAI
jgi:hypothetical protein